ncbi:hypothetical protein BC831DRAFT_465803, partial [Entophlyctis helioformis]
MVADGAGRADRVAWRASKRRGRAAQRREQRSVSEAVEAKGGEIGQRDGRGEGRREGSGLGERGRWGRRDGEMGEMARQAHSRAARGVGGGVGDGLDLGSGATDSWGERAGGGGGSGGRSSLEQAERRAARRRQRRQRACAERAAASVGEGERRMVGVAAGVGAGRLVYSSSRQAGVTRRRHRQAQHIPGVGGTGLGGGFGDVVGAGVVVVADGRARQAAVQAAAGADEGAVRAVRAETWTAEVVDEGAMGILWLWR